MPLIRAPHWSIVRRSAYMRGRRRLKRPRTGRGSPSGDLMFWLFSFRSREASPAESSWRKAFRAPHGGALAALMTFSRD
ncbi:hypothetical protein GCM10008171_21110 [Methylopila jiangsuensis]|uniref:Uncharacterized protein n=1 Tax=Methylopila jiangsuensis TaxID=586230 RepID=A0A9W6N482_9HYPH|nr:hypothetical protein GCM10008171_21110 [Methylopila jiangsuensis]